MISYGTLTMSSGFIWTECFKILSSLYTEVNIFKVGHPECNNIQVTGRIFESTVLLFGRGFNEYIGTPSFSPLHFDSTPSQAFP